MMKKLGFLSNLMYALRKRMGWCPKPPTSKDVILTKTALNKGTAYMEKPSISLGTLLSPVYPWGAALITWLMMQYAISVVPPWKRVTVEPVFFLMSLMTYIFLILGPIMPIPFILKREIHITNTMFHVRFGFSEDNIALYDIESIERVKRRPVMFSGIRNWVSGPDGSLGWGQPLGLFLLGVAKIKGVKWYVFGMRQTYLKVNKRNGDAVCVGVRNPELFLEGLTMRAPDIKIIRNGDDGKAAL